MEYTQWGMHVAYECMALYVVLILVVMEYTQWDVRLQ